MQPQDNSCLFLVYLKTVLLSVRFSSFGEALTTTNIHTSIQSTNYLLSA